MLGHLHLLDRLRDEYSGESAPTCRRVAGRIHAGVLHLPAARVAPAVQTEETLRADMSATCHH